VCLILTAVDRHPRYSLVLGANRDEFLDRETAQARFWEDYPQVLAGRDLRGGGTWMGVTLEGRVCALTNYRDPSSRKEGAPSRGRLVSRFLTGEEPPAAFLDAVAREGPRYNGFNIIAGLGPEIYWYSNRSGEGALRIPPGVHGISNRLLNTPWPKVVRGVRGVERLLDVEDDPSPESLFSILEDRTLPPDRDLPETGVGLDWERVLSPLHIESPTYGTRSSTLLLVERGGRVTFVERTYDRPLPAEPTVSFSFVLPGPPAGASLSGD